MKFIAFDLLDEDYEFFETEDEAVEWCKEAIQLQEGSQAELDNKIGYAKTVKFVHSK